MRKLLSMFFVLLTIPAAAKDHAANYQVGTLINTESLRDVNIFGSALANASTAFSHNVHSVRTADGVYVISSPVSTAGSLLMAMATNNQAPADIHIAWFMDDMHSGDKVLFSAECDKHNNCTFYLPKPDQPKKEYHTTGHFYPAVAVTNTTQLCGTGKLAPAVEAQVCQQPKGAAVPAAAPAASPALPVAMQQAIIVNSEASKPSPAVQSVPQDSGRSAAEVALESGNKLYEQGRYTDAFTQYYFASETDDATVKGEAQFRIGMIYLHGSGITKDRETAIKWLKSAASLGNQSARDALAKIESGSTQ